MRGKLFLTREKNTCVIETVPYIRFTKEYHAFNNLFSVAGTAANGFYGNFSYKNLYFGFCEQVYDSGTVKIAFSVFNNSEYEIKADYMTAVNSCFNKDSVDFEIFDAESEFNALYNAEKPLVFKMTHLFSGNSLYFVAENSFIAELNGKKINASAKKPYKINFEKNNNVLYLNSKICLSQKQKIMLDIVVFNSPTEVKKYLYLGKKEYFDKSIYIPEFSFEIFSDNGLFDDRIEKLISNIYESFYYSCQNDESFVFNLSFMLRFDINLLLYADKIDVDGVKGKLYKLALLIEVYTHREIRYEASIKNLAGILKNEEITVNEETLEAAIFLTESISELSCKSDLYKSLSEIKFLLEKQLKTYDYYSLINEVENNYNSDTMKKAYYVLIAKKYIGKNNYGDFVAKIMKTAWFTKDAVINNDYLKCLYNIYGDDTKDFVFDTVMKEYDKVFSLAALRIIIEKMLGYRIVKNSVDASPDLPAELEKVVINHRFGNGLYTYIAKRGQDFFSVNDVEFKKAIRVKLKKGCAKIICSSK